MNWEKTIILDHRGTLWLNIDDVLIFLTEELLTNAEGTPVKTAIKKLIAVKERYQ